MLHRVKQLQSTTLDAEFNLTSGFSNQPVLENLHCSILFYSVLVTPNVSFNFCSSCHCLEYVIKLAGFCLKKIY